MFKTRQDIDNKKQIFDLTYRAALSRDIRRGDEKEIYHQTLVNTILDNIQILPNEDESIVLSQDEFNDLNERLLEILKEKSQIEY